MKENTVPRWIRRREPEPYPDAFRDALTRFDVSCCATHRAQKDAMLASLESPAELCVLCGHLGVWRSGWCLREAIYVPRGCTNRYLPTAYYDLCAPCTQAPDAHARADATMRLRYWAALN
jgi:hypothetical protein